jgi:hypothetical protein
MKPCESLEISRTSSGLITATSTKQWKYGISFSKGPSYFLYWMLWIHHCYPLGSLIWMNCSDFSLLLNSVQNRSPALVHVIFVPMVFCFSIWFHHYLTWPKELCCQWVWEILFWIFFGKSKDGHWENVEVFKDFVNPV